MTDEYAEARRKYLMVHRECEIKVRGTCTRWSREIHHRAGRTGLALTDPEGFAATCRPCHSYTEEHREWAKAHGWIVRRTVSK